MYGTADFDPGTGGYQGTVDFDSDPLEKPIKVFILAGQSNMAGTGFVKIDTKRNGGKDSLSLMKLLA